MRTSVVNIIYIVLFSINSLSSIVVVALTGVEWGSYTPTQKFIVVTAVTGNWTGMLLALLKNLVAKEKAGKTLADEDNGNTKTYTKNETKTSPPNTTIGS